MADKIGFVGLGIMGKPMSKNLLTAGYDLTVYDIVPAPVAEVVAAKELLASLHLRRREGVEIIACPTCGRTTADVNALAEKVRAALGDVREHVVVAVMGCVVNGPGEAEGADVAVCCGKGRAAIYRQGRRRRTVAQEKILEALLAEVRTFLAAKA